MDFIDSILNVTALLLWLSFRGAAFPPPTAAPAATLLSTLRRTDHRRPRRWTLLAALAGILAGRVVLYLQLGPAVQWTPELSLGVTVLAFKGGSPVLLALYSLAGFFITAAVFYLWLVLLSVANRALPDAEPVQRLVRLHLGWVERLPALLRLLLPPLLIILAWWAVNPLLVKSGALPAARGAARVWEQGVVVAAGAVFAWKFIIAGLLLLHLLNSYVYLGEATFWPWVEATAKNLLGPLKKFPLRLARVDLAPVAAIALVWVAAHFGLRMLTRLFGSLLA